MTTDAVQRDVPNSAVAERVPSVRRASGFADLLGAFALVQENYVRMGFKPSDTGLYHFSIYNLLPTTRTLIAELDGTITGTVTIVPDSELGVPHHAVFPEVHEAMAREGHAVGEVTMLADRRLSAARAWPQLRAMFHGVVEEARAAGLTRLVVLCHPRHAAFYQRRLPFQQVGEERACPHVSGAPAVPLVLNVTDENLFARAGESLGHWGGAVGASGEAGGAYRLTDQRAAALVAMQPAVLAGADALQRAVLQRFYPTLHDRLRYLRVGQSHLS